MKPLLEHSPARFVALGRIFFRLVLALALIGLVSWTWAMASRATASSERRERLLARVPRVEREAEYVSSHRCQSCHPGEHASWRRTFHRSMTQFATPENVMGAFDGSTVEAAGLQYRVYRNGDEFWAEMPDPDQLMYTVQGGKRLDPMTYLVRRDKDSPVEKLDIRDIPRVHRQVVFTTGSHHYQTYWVRGDAKFGNLLQTLPLVYLIKDQRWIPRDAAFMDPPHEARAVTQWNHHCIRCHSTGGVPGLDAQTQTFETRVGELGISCEACHGPGEEHIRANRDPLRRYRLHLTGAGDPTIIQPEKLDHERSSQICGQCHGVYVMRDEYAMEYAFEGVQYRPGEDLFRTRYYIQHPTREATSERLLDLRANPNFFRERWWDDGTVLAGGREFTAMVGSACYRRGEISCLSCHSMHESDPVDQLRLDVTSRQSCTQCHRDSQYTTEVAAHTHHAEDSAGSDCLNCHMPHTTYALLGAIRNHEISIPQIASGASYGVPNACNLCHLDRTLAWTQEHLQAWYGRDAAYLTSEQSQLSAALLWLLKGNAAQRVVAAWHFGWAPAHEASGQEWLAPFVGQLLQDPYGVVRYVAHDALRQLRGFEDFEYDFLTPAAERAEQVRNVVHRWQRQRDRQLAPSRHLLIDDQGELDRDRLEQLLRQRDDRPVTIKE